MHGALPERELQALEFAVKQFEPWRERLWSVQSDSVKEAVTHLGYAFLMLRRFFDALALAREAESHGYFSAELLRVLR